MLPTGGGLWGLTGRLTARDNFGKSAGIWTRNLGFGDRYVANYATLLFKLWCRRRDLNSQKKRVLSAPCPPVAPLRQIWRSLQESNLCKWICSPSPVSTRPSDLKNLKSKGKRQKAKGKSGIRKTAPLYLKKIKCRPFDICLLPFDFKYLVWMMGLEPTASNLASSRSKPIELHPQNFGTAGRTWTFIPGVWDRCVCQLRHSRAKTLVQGERFELSRTDVWDQRVYPLRHPCKNFGADERTRTSKKQASRTCAYACSATSAFAT